MQKLGLHTAAVLASGVALASCGGSPPRPPAPQRPASRATHPRDSRHHREDPLRRLLALGLPIYCGGERGHELALTFDDGPGVYTRLALRKLRAAHERATFFDVGRSIENFPKLLRPELRLGTIGDHTQTHLELTALSPRQVRYQLARAAYEIRIHTGLRVRLWRPPYELHNATVDRIAHRLGLLEILWDVDSRDSLGANYAEIIRDVAAGLHPGAIIEMHENRGQTIRALTTLLPLLRRRHLRSVTVPQLLAQDPPSLAQVRHGIIGCGIRPGRRLRRAE